MLTLTSDQEAATAAFVGFILSNDKEMVISGPAGVGKTTLLKHLMKMKDAHTACGLVGKKPITNWALTATTNKAAEVLQETTGIPASTIHSLLGLRVTNDYSSGRTKIVRKPNASVLDSTVIVIDECSMVDSDLYAYIDMCTVNCKIIYVGDHCQMAPIMEPLSQVFAKNDPVYLNQVMRSQHAPTITALCRQLRETVETGVFQPIVSNDPSIAFLDPAQAEAKIQDVFLKDEAPNARLLYYTNAKVQRMNSYLRQMRNLPAKLVTGEQVISNSMVYSLNNKEQYLRVEEEVKVLSTNIVDPYEFGLNGQKFHVPVYQVVTDVGSYLVPEDADTFRDTLKELARQKAWPQLFDLKEHIADLRPRDACTVYKAQGSTYHTVFVDLSDIGTCTNAAQAARMLYVACSRATHQIYFIGKLPDRFAG